MKNNAGKFTYLLLVCVLLSAAFSAGRTADANSERTLATEQKRTVVVTIARDPQRRQEDIAALAQVDVLGVDYRANEVTVHVTPGELRHLIEAGFQFTFVTGANWQAKNDVVTWSSATPVDGYLNPGQIIAFTLRLQKEFPALVKVIEIGKTTRGRPIMAMQITSGKNADEKPVVLFNGMHHARELMTAEVMVDIAEQLTGGYGRNPEITAWLDTYRVVVVPQVNPDGNQLVHDGKRMWRKNAASDGRTVVGVDLNRNYPLTWNQCNGSSGRSSSESYRGPSAASEPETKAMLNLIASVRPVANLSYHSFSEMILYPFGCAGEKNPMLALFKDVAGGMRANIADDSGKTNTYQVGTPSELLYSTDGDDMSWQLKQWQVVSLALEINDRRQGFQPDFTAWRNLTVQRQRGGWMSVLRRMGGAGVRAQLQTKRGIEDVTYALFSKGAGANRLKFTTAFTPEGVEPARARTPKGLLFLLAMPGRYELRVSRSGSVIKTLPVEIGNKTVDLGVISLDAAG